MRVSRARAMSVDADDAARRIVEEGLARLVLYERSSLRALLGERTWKAIASRK